MSYLHRNELRTSGSMGRKEVWCFSARGESGIQVTNGTEAVAKGLNQQIPGSGWDHLAFEMRELPRPEGPVRARIAADF